jgi:hypothetical protein
MVMPCGREDGRNGKDEMPFKLDIRKKGNSIFTRANKLLIQLMRIVWGRSSWGSLSTGRKYSRTTSSTRALPTSASTGSLSRWIRIQRKETFVPFIFVLYYLIVLHILYMKSSEKALSRNYNAQELELFCHNRFYGPLVVAYNSSKPPYFLVDFESQDLEIIAQINRNF